MAKRQRSLTSHYFSRSKDVDVIEIMSSGSENESSPETGHSTLDRRPPSDAEIAQGLWKEQWAVQFEWLQFAADVGRVFCRVCGEKGGRSAYAKDGSKNFKVSAFQDHSRSVEHRRLAWAMNSGGKVMEKVIVSGQKACDSAVASLVKAAYFLGKQSLPYSKFPSLCKLLVSVNAPMTLSLYQDEKSCANIMACISDVIQKQVLNRVRNSSFYGIMVDESTDISVTGHLVVFGTIVEEGLPVTLFLGLLPVDGGKDAALIYEALISQLRAWGLDLRKFLGFGSDGAATMTGCHTGVATRIKKEVNPYLLATHCVAHRTNLAALDAAKAPNCKVISGEVDSLLNSISSFFHKSSKRKHALTALQDELFDAKKSMKRYHKIRWLSRWQSVSTLCDSLESVLVYFRDADDGQGVSIFERLSQFKIIYILFFLADILHCLAMLSKVFQCKFVDVTSIGSIVRTEIAQIRMLFLVETTDLNAATFSESTGYHILPEYGPFGGYMRKLSSQIRGNMFHDVAMCRSRLGTDLEEALAFQQAFAEAVCAGLDARFKDNDVLSCFKILNPSNMPSKQVGLQNWGVSELDRLLQLYGEDRSHSGSSFPPFLDVQDCKREFLSFKLQCTTEWGDKNFRDLWGMITWNHALQTRYPNLLVLAEIARVQCVSTATCERAFSIQNLIKTRVRNKLGSKNLDCLLRVALEGPDEEYDGVIADAISLWKSETKYKFLYANPATYLSNSSPGPSVSNASSYLEALDQGTSVS